MSYSSDCLGEKLQCEQDWKAFLAVQMWHDYYKEYLISFESKNFHVVQAQARRQGGLGGLQPPQFLADQLTLSQPGGAHYPHLVLRAPPGFQTLRRPCKVLINIQSSTKNFDIRRQLQCFQICDDPRI